MKTITEIKVGSVRMQRRYPPGSLLNDVGLAHESILLEPEGREQIVALIPAREER